MTKPLLIYDGDCGFCNYWVNYWKKLTGSSVDYRPYQEVAADYPSLTIKDFKRAVQYVAPDGTISAAAKASFLTLSHAKNNKIWMKLYNSLPGFAYLTEKLYAVISSHRTLFYYVSICFWGKNFEPPKYELISWWFLRLLGCISLIAFVSFGVQALGLVGEQGIFPVSELIANVKANLGLERYWYFPIIFWINSSNLMIQAAWVIGSIFSLLLIFGIRPITSLFVIYFLYLSIMYVSQVFMSFQWDMLLIETSLLAIILARFTVLGIWLCRFLVFRFFLAAGLVKILSGDVTWGDYSALTYYFMTEPLPTPLAWYAHSLPLSILTFGAWATLTIELILPFFIFLPRYFRFFAAFGFLILQIIILLTGNYNFFNLLTMLLCLTLFDDAAIRSLMSKKFVDWISAKKLMYPHNTVLSFLAAGFAVITISISIIQFHIKFGEPVPDFLLRYAGLFQPFQLVNSYGPFAVITTRRPEIIIEGSNDGVTWSEYKFRYKPGDVTQPLKWNFPHQPRVDWQMWFAALDTVQNNPWFVRLIERILQNSPDVMAFFVEPPAAPPRFVRAELYDYRFATPEERKQSGIIWKRRLVGHYFPAVHLKE